MTTTLPPLIEPVAWFEYARKKPTLKRLVFDRTSRSQLRVAGWVSEPLVKESDATTARADLEAENSKLREALERAELFIDEVRQDLHHERITDWYPEGANSSAATMSESMRVIANRCADFEASADLENRA